MGERCPTTICYFEGPLEPQDLRRCSIAFEASATPATSTCCCLLSASPRALTSEQFVAWLGYDASRLRGRSPD